MAVVLGSSLNGNVNLAANNTVYLLNDFEFILDDNDDAIDLIASGTELVVRGTLGSDSLSGINVGSLETSNTIVIASTGIVSGNDEGVFVQGDFTSITNNGKITANDDGVDFNFTSINALNNFGEIVGGESGVESNGDDNQIWNHGQIVGQLQEAVGLDGTDNKLVNSGQLVSYATAAVVFTTSAGESNSLFNSGTIDGQDADGNAVVTGDGDELVINEGTINGNVSLGAGDDQFNGTGGTIHGSVFGGAGDDFYIVDDPMLELVENADEGIDSVKANAGFTLEDNIEHLNLVGDGDHTGVGNSLDNVINGNIGDNTINGGAGDDVLRGNDGNDTLYGALGDDRLVGGPGDDRAFGGNGSDNMLGGAGDDVHRGGAGDDRLVGGPGDDRLFGGNGDDRLIGGRGEDVLVGDVGSDVLRGGADADWFVYDSIQESLPGPANRDRINDFDSADGDRIDLSGIDADVNTAGDDGFTFIGTSGFSGTAGELRYVSLATSAVVNGDVDGDGNADFQVFVASTNSLSAGDFIL